MPFNNLKTALAGFASWSDGGVRERFVILLDKVQQEIEEMGPEFSDNIDDLVEDLGESMYEALEKRDTGATDEKEIVDIEEEVREEAPKEVITNEADFDDENVEEVPSSEDNEEPKDVVAS